MTGAADAARECFGERWPSIERYVDILLSRGVDWGLVGPREHDRIWQRHILNCLAPARLIPEGAEVVDVGSGAGLPGIPLALYRADLRVTLLDSLQRRVAFLEDVVSELELQGRVRVLRARAEETDGDFDVVVARAVAPLSLLVPWTQGLRAKQGTLLALKGERAAAEVGAATDVLRRYRLAADLLTIGAHPAGELTTVVRIRPISPTPARRTEIVTSP